MPSISMYLRIKYLATAVATFAVIILDSKVSAQVEPSSSPATNNSVLVISVDENGNLTTGLGPIVAFGGYSLPESTEKEFEKKPGKASGPQLDDGKEVSKAEGGRKVDGGAEEMETGSTSSSKKTAIIIGVATAIAAMLLVSLCICRYILRKRSTNTDGGGVGTLSDRSSLGFLTEFRSGGDDTNEEAGFGGWLRRSCGRPKRYAAESLEMDFVKSDIENCSPVDDVEKNTKERISKDKASNSIAATGESEVDDVELHNVDLQDLSDESSTVTVGEGVVRGSSLVGQLHESGWSQVENDIAGFDYVIGLGPRNEVAGVNDFMSRRYSSHRLEAQKLHLKIDSEGRTTTPPRSRSIDTIRAVESDQEGSLEFEDPPLADPYHFRRFPPPASTL